MTRFALAAAACFGLLATPASAATHEVRAQFSDFGPPVLAVLPGETVDWNNVSERTHTVTADDGSFDSGDLGPGAHFARAFEAVGAVAYHCRVHPGMVGQVDVRRVTLDPLPPAAVPSGNRVEMQGRTASPAQPVTIERDTGTGFRAVTAAAPSPDGSWSAAVTAQATGDYRAVVGGDASQTRRLLVTARKVLIRATRRGISVSVTPALPYARVQLQVDLLERFGWWPQKTTRLDYLSAAAFAVKSPARVRVAVVDRDGWTPLATSRALSLGHVGRRAPPGAEHHAH